MGITSCHPEHFKVDSTPKDEEIEIQQDLLDATDAVQNTPLHWASGSGQLDCMQFLIQHGCKIDPRNALGDTPLHRFVKLFCRN
jgi:ankyrin repeat protein